jgi:hypothetical protein
LLDEQEMISGGSMEINRVRARVLPAGEFGGGGTALSLRLCRLLGGLSLHPAGIPPSSLLVVRSMADPLPGKIDLERSIGRIDLGWERAVRDALTERYCRAARPWRGPVSPSADAVLFADEGEMLACLALDMSRGQAAGLWWWQGILRGLPSSSSAGLQALLCSRAAAVPAALHHLAERGRAATVIEALSAEQARTTLGAVCRAYGLADLDLESPDSPAAKAARFRTSGPAGMPVAEREERGAKMEAGFSRLGAAIRTDQPRPAAAPSLSEPGYSSSAISPESTGLPPWEKRLQPGAFPFHLGKERACLLGVGLTLYRAPAAARNDAFLRSFRNWWVAPRASPALRPHPVPSTGVPAERLAPLQPQAQRRRAETPGASTGGSGYSSNYPQSGRFSDPLEPQPGHTSDEASRLRVLSAPVKRSTFDSSAGLAQGASLVQRVGAGETHALWHGPGEGPDPGHESLSGLPVLAGPQAYESVETQTGPDYGEGDAFILCEKSLCPEGGVDTELGGVLFLINLMVQLDLPACFENGWSLASRVGAWGVLETLARGLLIDHRLGLNGDPIWTVLAELDSREPGTLPGEGFQGAEYFCLPAAWLARIPRAERKLFDHAALADLRGSLAEGLHPGLSRWLASVLPYICLCLRRVLDPSSTELFDLPKALLLRRGRLYVTSTHVDLVMSMEDVAVPIRMAGLDFNPGWLPDFGRVISFHFE